MTQESGLPRYVTCTPEEVAEMRASAESSYGAEDRDESGLDRAIRYLTWGILSVCLALWAVVGFIFWVPLLFRSMFKFTFALSQGMLQGVKPDEAGRILRETVEFYRRGFTVAVDAVFGKPQKPKQPQVRLRPSGFLFELGVAVVFWYLVLFLLGIVETSPAGLWEWVRGLPWPDLWGSVTNGAEGVVEGVTGGVAESTAG